MAKIIFFISVIFLSAYLTEQSKLSSHHNKTHGKNKSTTKTLMDGENVDPHTLEHEHAMLSGVMRLKTNDTKYVSDENILKEFDARTYWPHCKTISEVHNQGSSLVDLAYATTGALADRMCIATNGTHNQLLSAEEVVSCSGLNYRKHVYSFEVWNYLKRHGVVSGGKYNTNDGCQPFQVPPICEIPTFHNRHTCIRQCFGNKSIDYNHDRVYVEDFYHLDVPKTVQKEVQANGPVVAYFELYDDFYFYTSGVYEKSKTAKFVRGHHAKLIGWGVENGVNYWLLVNSMGNEWGQNGFFKIKRGTDECQIDHCITGVIPKIK